MTLPTFEYDVALSFAEEDRIYVDQVAHALVEQQVRVFYDDFVKAELWGRDLYSYFDEVYRKRARFALLFVSAHYAAKAWTAHERQSAQARALVDLEPYLLPVRLDDSELPGLRPTVGFVDGRTHTPAEIADLVLAKLGRAQDSGQTIARVPRTAAATTHLLRTRPDGWEFVLFAGALLQGQEALEHRWRDHQVGYVTSAGWRLRTDAEATQFLTDRFERAQTIMGNVNRLMTPERSEAMFGKPGVSGDADLIQHTASRIISTYEQFLDWAAEVRSASPPDHFATLFGIAARFVDMPLAQFRQFVDDYVAFADNLASLSDGNGNGNGPIIITFTLVVTVDDALMDEHEREIARLRKARRRGRWG